MALKGAQLDLSFYKNNLILDSRPNNNDYIAMNLRSASTNFENDHNTIM